MSNKSNFDPEFAPVLRHIGVLSKPGGEAESSLTNRNNIPGRKAVFLTDDELGAVLNGLELYRKQIECSKNAEYRAYVLLAPLSAIAKVETEIRLRCEFAATGNRD